MNARICFEILSSAIVGAVMVYLVPQNYVLPIILMVFGICIALGWIITFQNRAIDFRSRSISPIKSFTIIKPSGSVRAIGVFSAFAIGACLWMLWVANA